MKAVIKAIIAGSVIIGVGLMIFIIGLALNGWKLMPKFDMAQFTAQGEITELKIDNAVGDVKTQFYDGDRVIVDYPESDRYGVKIEEKDGALSVNGLNKKHWYNFTFLPSALPVTTIKIPQGSVLKLKVTVNAGKVELAEGVYSEASLTVNAGSLSALGVACSEFKCEVNAGSVSVKSLESATLDCRVKAGSFSADRVTCPSIKVNVSAGSAGLKVLGSKEAYTIFVDKSAGSSSVTNQTGTDPEKKIDVKVSAGSVNISFI